MGYELTYEDGKFYIWSTVVDDYISGPLDSPHQVAMFIVNRGREDKLSEVGVPFRDEKAMQIYKIWVVEAKRVKRSPEEGAQIIGTMDIQGIEGDRKPTLEKYEEPVRMTPKLKELQVRYREEREGGG